MTPAELDAIRARDAVIGRNPPRVLEACDLAAADRRALLAEVDRLLKWQRRAVNWIQDAHQTDCANVLSASDMGCPRDPCDCGRDALIEEAGHE